VSRDQRRIVSTTRATADAARCVFLEREDFAIAPIQRIHLARAFISSFLFSSFHLYHVSMS